ncbi:MAG: substrate-binding domain-containing protein, partial [Candidatus Hadarchaeum sp.]
MKVHTTTQQKINRRDFIRMTAGVALALFVPACHRASPSAFVPPTGWIETQRYRKAAPWRIGRSGRGNLSSWMIMFSAHIEYGIRVKYKEHFNEFYSIPANWDPNKQIQDIQKLLAKGIDLLLIDPLDDAMVAKGIQQAMARDVPVILAASTIQNAPYVSTVMMNEEERGARCADWLSHTVTSGNVVILASQPTAGDHRAWLKGVHRSLDAQPHIRQVKEATCFWSAPAAKEAMSAILSQFSTIDG